MKVNISAGYASIGYASMASVRLYEVQANSACQIINRNVMTSNRLSDSHIVRSNGPF